MLDTRRLLVSLPNHKAIGWKAQIDMILKNKTISEKELSSILLRLENIAQVQIVLGHFLSDIRQTKLIE